MNKFIIFFCAFAVLFFAANIAYSGEYHHSQPIAPSNITQVINNQSSNGVALGIAMSQLGYDWSSKSIQAGVGAGSFDGEDAISIGVGKRIDRVLLNGSVGREGNKYGYGLGVRIHF